MLTVFFKLHEKPFQFFDTIKRTDFISDFRSNFNFSGCQQSGISKKCVSVIEQQCGFGHV